MILDLNSKSKIAYHKVRRGFTLIELLLVSAILVLIGSFSAPLFSFMQTQNNIDVATMQIAQTMRRAQFLARASDGDASWGIYAHAGTLTLFQGNSYAVRDSVFDEIVDVPNVIVPSGMTEVVFEKFSGNPNVTETLTLTGPKGEVRAITVNSKGMVEY